MNLSSSALSHSPDSSLTPQLFESVLSILTRRRATRLHSQCRLLSTNARISQARSLWGIYLLRIYHHMIYCRGHVEPGGPPRRAPAASPRSFFRSFRFGRRRKARLSDHARRQNTLCGIRLDWTCNSLHYDPALGRACFCRGGGVSATHQTQNVQPYFSRNRLAQSGVPATG